MPFEVLMTLRMLNKTIKVTPQFAGIRSQKEALKIANIEYETTTISENENM